MKKAFALLLALAAVLTLAACGSKEKPVDEDVYEGVRCRFVGDEEWTEDEPFSLTLRADGTGVHKRDGVEFDVTWALDGENITVSETFVGDPIVYTGTLSGDELHLYNGDPENLLTCEYIYKLAGK